MELTAASSVPNLYQLDMSSKSPLTSTPPVVTQTVPPASSETHEIIRTTSEATRPLGTNMNKMLATQSPLGDCAEQRDGWPWKWWQLGKLSGVTAPEEAWPYFTRLREDPLEGHNHWS